MALKRELGLFDATMVVVGGIIGTGIFVNPYIVARALDSTPLVLGAWLAGGVVAIIGALAYAELGQQQPQAGGPYVYLRDAWHPMAGFMYGWAQLLMIEAGGMAAVALNFARYSLRLAGREETGFMLIAVAAGAILLLTAINYAGVRPGSRVVNVSVVLKLAALVVLIAFAFWGEAAPSWSSESRADETPSGVLAFGAALIPILFTYGGWQKANTVAEEMRDPQRDMPRSLIMGTLIVIAIYLLANVAYLRTLGLGGLAGTETPAASVAGLWLGAGGARFISATIAISTFGFLNLGIMASPRIYFAMARDGVFVPALARLHPRFQTPALAILLQSAWALALLFTGKYEDLLNTVVFADWVFFGLTVAGLFRLRRRFEGREGFRTPGYPFLPGLFVLVAITVVLSVIRTAPERSAVGVALLALGVPVYYWSKAQAASTPGSDATSR
ncbi:MAG: amino acid permease [Vicinamibacteria bacterium]|nr:amino acid permease [Vicinamibacteria bacterium]